MLKKFPLFAGLSDDHLTRLKGISRQILVKKGSILFAPGDASQGFYAVRDGAVRIYRVSSGGKEITLEIAETRSTFAEASLFSDVYHCYAEALKDSTVYLVRKDAFLEMIQKDIRFAARWMHILSLEIIHLRQRIEELSLKSPRARIVSYILLLSEVQNTPSIKLPVHRKSIATLLGMTHETFYRTANSLENEGMVRFDGQKVEIVNRLLLENVIE
ncbi:MAG: Crp/Fnr family transcriptional regulator [Desulfobacterales bacterium]|uniref:Crp/Fnr family transcriptional regulator n=1 Tax=Candidatus Desulfatibia profunda TaxID=2841695 RepID=A0A8J6NWJ2_9BACT|nr:Crp/Fnr family transcriptional regulator [Candidatus Desulfatibia profunda]MBL7178608.1 Crp/Fnr family transcriptional regulator [Desulfobacterales bacterium]